MRESPARHRQSPRSAEGSPTMIAISTIGSSGLVPYRIERINASRRHRRPPTQSPIQSTPAAAHRTAPDAIPRFSARPAPCECRSPYSLGYQIGKHSIKTNRRQQQRQDGKSQHQRGAEALGGGGLTHNLLHGQDVVDRQRRIERGHLLLNGNRKRQADRRQSARQASPRWSDRESPDKIGKYIMGLMGCVTSYTVSPTTPMISYVLCSDSTVDVLANRVFPGKELIRKFLADDRVAGRARAAPAR